MSTQLPTASPLRCQLYPPMNDSRSPWTNFAGSGQGFCVHRAEGKRCAALDLGAGNGPLALGPGVAWDGLPTGVGGTDHW